MDRKNRIKNPIFSPRSSVFSPKITQNLGEYRKNWEKRSEKLQKKKKKRPPFIITYFGAVVKPRFFYRGYRMELFRVHLKTFQGSENSSGILQKFQMKNPGFDPGLVGG